MTIIHDCPEARWLPCRSHFAIFRLASFIRLRTARPSKGLRMALIVDRDQNAFENFSICAILLVLTICYLAALLDRWMPWPAAAAVAIVLTPAALHLPYFFTGLLVMPVWRRITGRTGENNIAASSVATMAVVLALSLWFAVQDEPIAIVAATALALLALNAAAAVVMWALRRRVRELEARCGA